MKMKTIIYALFIVLLLSTSSISCNETNNGEDTEMTETTQYHGKTIPYSPVDSKQFPQWMQDYLVHITNGNKCLIYQMTCNGKTIYNIIDYYMSCSYGNFYDNEGKLLFTCDLTEIEKTLKNAYDVKCIYMK